VLLGLLAALFDDALEGALVGRSFGSRALAAKAASTTPATLTGRFRASA
jgi:hypothetical protein